MERTARLKIDLKEKGIPVAVWKLNGSQPIKVIISEETCAHFATGKRVTLSIVLFVIDERTFVYAPI